MKLRNIEILEKDSNKKGDLFGRLMSDLFHTLGYEIPRLNVHKSGREIDLSSYHRTERKMAIAECKAHSDTIGGTDINKFVGVVDAEKRKMKKSKALKNYSLTGYFISLSGFKETAIEQEEDLGNSRIILLKPKKIVEELISGRVLVSIEQAVSAMDSQAKNLKLLDYMDLLAYEKGWVWAVYYSDSTGQQANSYALIHAEGKPLIRELANEIILLDSNIKGLFSGLNILNADDPTILVKQGLATTLEKYYKYLEIELGDIQFEGLPTDKEAGSVRVKLESIFVPLHFSKSQEEQRKHDIDLNEDYRENIGQLLKNKTRLAILAKPGGGKSTLIKRLAMAYAFPKRRQEINDSLPARDWFPIFLRCRELGDRVLLSITEIITGIPLRAEIQSCTNEFSILVSDALQNGKALLLIDGLDEIAEDKNRIAFVNQLRTFIATYPTINIIVTSREAGFRAVAGSLATYCDSYNVSNLNPEEIRELSLKWHKAIIDESDNTIKEANRVSDLILKDNRIKVLAENPLLLTTLLFVKRWAGYIPTKRSILYQEMIKLLLVTWNVEGHEILDIEEAEPQLAFVAYWMINNGRQTITADELKFCLVEARKQMPEILGYTNITPSEFIKRVESRSSLLILSGHQRTDSGNLIATYEFLHLSFQEYLAAKAIVKRFIPISDINKSALEIIKPNIDKENWKEVVPLVAVLLERNTKDLIEYLIAQSQIHASESGRKQVKASQMAVALLGSCLANEVQIAPDLLRTAIEWYSKNKYAALNPKTVDTILQNKFGISFRETVKECFFEKYDDRFVSPLGSMLAEIFLIDVKNSENTSEVINEISKILKTKNKEDKCIAILGFMHILFQLSKSFPIDDNIKIQEEIFTEIRNLLKTDDIHYRFSIYWCLAWAGRAGLFPEEMRTSIVGELTNSWTKFTEQNLHRVNSWALSEILIPSINPESIKKNTKLENAIQDNFNKPANEFDKLAAIYLATILGIKFEINEVIEAFRVSSNRRVRKTHPNSSLSQFSKALGIKTKKDK